MPSIEPHDADSSNAIGPPVIQNGLQRTRHDGRSPSRRYARPSVTSSNADHHPREPLPSPERTLRPASNLLMAPPTTWTGHIRHKLWLGYYHLAQLVGLGDESVSVSVPFLLRLGIFLGKMLTLLRPCWPYVVNPWLGAVLVLIAGLDLGPVPSMAQPRSSWERSTGLRPVRISGFLVLVHFVILWAAGRWGPLCAMPDITAGSGIYP